MGHQLCFLLIKFHLLIRVLEELLLILQEETRLAGKRVNENGTKARSGCAQGAHGLLSQIRGSNKQNCAQTRYPGSHPPILYSLPLSVRGGLVTFTPGLLPELPTQAGEESPGRREGRGAEAQGGPGWGRGG